ncbi:MAG: C-GCAxxG-C-C family protein [Anaerotignum sp.]|nr:C-GCAxxG-C-C family protein [Anaerotignum sp.]MBQ3568474.1 C-GCAxxG-C-C family protein [Anaerotignum sp.]MBQ7103626.1 C-GCAxxG-C-C family protein [Anaerotignum sp.]
MLKERVRAYCHTEENCSRILLLAAAEEYGFSLSEDILSACGGISGGFGIGSICSALVAAVMILGILCGDRVQEKRLLLLWKVQERFGYLDCGRLSSMGEDCGLILEEIADILQEVIEDEK